MGRDGSESKPGRSWPLVRRAEKDGANDRLRRAPLLVMMRATDLGDGDHGRTIDETVPAPLTPSILDLRQRKQAKGNGVFGTRKRQRRA